MTTLACIGEPISWLRLETFASGRATDPAIASHLAHVPLALHPRAVGAAERVAQYGAGCARA